MGVLWQTEPDKTAANATSPDPSPLPDSPRQRHLWRRLFWLLVVITIAALAYAMYAEMRTSRLQAREFSRWANSLTYEVQPGPSQAIVYPGAGPFDKRLGYSALGDFLPRLLKRNYVIERQTQFSPALMSYAGHDLFVPYQEKSQAGLVITDCRGDPLYLYRYPQQLYTEFAQIPPVMVDSLLFVENRGLLDSPEPLLNPAVDWPRFAKAAWSQVARMFALPGQSAGGSTLATQLEKYRHSPDGLTGSGPEKIRQMISASVRAYQGGPQTLEARQRIVRDYLNSGTLLR
jgi:membrane peptidoglycan carboxypeptidase